MHIYVTLLSLHGNFQMNSLSMENEIQLTLKQGFELCGYTYVFFNEYSENYFGSMQQLEKIHR